MHRQIPIIQILLILLCLSLFCAKCTPEITGGSDSETPSTVGGRLEVRNLTIPAGTRTIVTSDVEIIASGDIVIDGELIADPAPINSPGYSISIIADGDIEIGGTIQAGAVTSGLAASARTLVGGKSGERAQVENDYLPGQPGGSLNLISRKGNITIKRNSTLIGVDGGDGVGGTLGVRGGNGGSVSLCAPYGRLVVRGNISLGNGGNGGDATVDSDTLQTILPDSAVLNIFDFTNVGGDSGRLFAYASTWDWPGIEFYYDLDNDLPSSAGSPAMDPIAYANDPNTGAIIGGIGGNAGLVSVIDDVGTKLIAELDRQWAGGEAPFEEKFTITAADGGRGWIGGGYGGGIIINCGKWSGRDGLTFIGRAGHGGAVGPIANTQSECGNAVPAIGAVGGLGGWASVSSPPGIPVVTDSGTGDGGNGGRAIAYGGEGGGTLTAILQTGGNGGTANTVAGAGADGRSSCFSGMIGNGGDGGPASAFGGGGGDGQVRGDGGMANAIAGIGGNGGDGGPTAGSAGIGGAAFTKLGAQGTTGQPGDVFELGAEFTEKADDGMAGRTDFYGCD